MLEGVILNISISGPSTDDLQDQVKEATKQWLANPRRKLAKQSHVITLTISTTEAAVQVDMPFTDLIAMWETVKAQDAEVDQMHQELENTAALLKLPDIDKDIDYSDYTDDEDYDESDSEI